jgi:hypothetical protein
MKVEKGVGGGTVFQRLLIEIDRLHRFEVEIGL